MCCSHIKYKRSDGGISPDKARKGVIYPLKTGIYALVGISERTFTRLISKQRGKIRSN